MNTFSIPVLGFAAFSGTGKTTLLTQLIPLLNKANIKCGIIKHSHHNFEIDQPGKDSFRLRKAGASPVLLVSSYRRAIITEYKHAIEPKLNDQLHQFDTDSVDLILVEGFKAEKFPKIELHRPILQKPLIYPNDHSVIAVASDQHLHLPDHLTNLDLNNPYMISDFIQHTFLAH
jgi:molybdopterin-guanine dinucleotide biosynthesis protein MobB